MTDLAHYKRMLAPQEGELRPQLLDRFGMHAQITTVKLPEAGTLFPCTRK